MLKRFFFCFLTILLYVCSEGTKGSPEVYFGLYCGECYRNCSIIIKLDENRALADTSITFFKWHFNQDSIDQYVFPDSIAVEISNSNYVRISQLFKFLPSNLDTAKRELDVLTVVTNAEYIMLTQQIIGKLIQITMENWQHS